MEGKEKCESCSKELYDCMSKVKCTICRKGICISCMEPGKRCNECIKALPKSEFDIHGRPKIRCNKCYAECADHYVDITLSGGEGLFRILCSPCYLEELKEQKDVVAVDGEYDSNTDIEEYTELSEQSEIIDEEVYVASGSEEDEPPCYICELPNSFMACDNCGNNVCYECVYTTGVLPTVMARAGDSNPGGTLTVCSRCYKKKFSKKNKK